MVTVMTGETSPTMKEKAMFVCAADAEAVQHAAMHTLHCFSRKYSHIDCREQLSLVANEK